MSNWRNALVHSDISIEDAIVLLSGNKVTVRVLLVVDKNNYLQGILNDGDIRRALLKNLPMTTQIKNVMNNNPHVISSPYSRDEVLKKMASLDIMQIPVVSENREVCGLETVHTISKVMRYDNPVFLMAGGFGKRLHPLTEDTPKPLLNVGEKPILEIILEQFIRAGFHNFFISIFYKSEKIIDYFGDGSSWGVSIKYIHEKSPLGTAGSLGLLPDNLKDLPIIMMNGDIFTQIDLEHLLHFHNSSNAAATVCVREYEHQIPYGVVELSNNKIINFIEKPLKKFLVNAGIYVLNKSLINTLDGKTALDMPDFLSNNLANDDLVVPFPIHEYWLDIGHISEYEKANIDIKKN